MFKLKELHIKNHYLFKDSVFQFVNSSELNNGPYSTILIGPNGTGKSQLLKLVVNIFRELNTIKSRKINYTQCNYLLRYSINQDVYTLTNNRKFFPEYKLKYDINKNSKEVKKNDLLLPSNVLANSIMLNDSFPVVNPSNNFYYYMGVRRSNAVAGTKSFIRKTVSYVIEAIQDSLFLKQFNNILEFLELENSFKIYYSPRYRHLLYTGNLSVKDFKKFFNKWNLRRDTIPFGLSYFNKNFKNNEKNTEKIVKFLNYLSNKKLIPLGKRSKIFEYDILNDKSIQEDFVLINMLDKLDLISYPSVKIRKANGEEFDIEASSSGEFHFLASILAIIALIKENSLILIDEPEISLHPNWQMRYIGFLKKFFGHYTSCHFIIATHSHFLISDLKDETSEVISLRWNDKNKLKSETLNKNTYGWSAEQILLEVFRVPTTRNFFIAEKISDIMRLLAEPELREEIIKEKIMEIKDLNLDKIPNNDPLKEVIDKLLAKI